MEILRNYPLLEHNTFRVQARAQWWVAYENLEDLDKLARDEYFATLRFINLGLGANTLFVGDFEGAVLHSKISDCDRVDGENKALPAIAENDPLLRVGSGVVWDQLVALTIANGLYGLENLSGIPSSVGAAVVQNIGAYGSEVGDFVESVELFDLKNGIPFRLTAKECNFAYRYSCFKESRFASCVVTHVVLRLSHNPDPNLSYQALAEKFTNDENPTPGQIRDHVLSIRASKLPDPQKLPNAGSFFKNPIITRGQFETLQRNYPQMPFWQLDNDNGIKIPAAWLIEKVGYKGKRNTTVGCYERQPLIVVNYGAEKGAEIVRFAEEIRQAINQEFGILLEPEVRYVEDSNR